MAAQIVDSFSALSTVNGTSAELPVPRAVLAGSSILLATVRDDDSAATVGGVASITDSSGNTWARHDAISLRSGQCEVAWHHCHVTTALDAGDTITVTWGSTRSRKLIVALVATGLDTAVGPDASSPKTVAVNPANSGPNGNSAAPSGSTTGATTAAQGLTVAAVGTGSAAGAVTAGAGYSPGPSIITSAGSTNRRLATEHRTTTATGVQTATVSMAASALWAMAIAHYPAATSTNVPPTADAGADQAGLEPGAAFTLTGTDSDPDGTIAARSWTQTGGPAVTLSGSGATRTAEAPPTLDGADLVFEYAVTEADGGTATDTTTVTVLPATERVASGGVLVPIQIRCPAGGTYAAAYPATY